jgi:signal transduction histidine kinase
MTQNAAGAGRRGHAGLATRLLVAQSLVLVAGALTTWLVATTVGPGIFHEHLQQAGVAHTPTESAHVEEAFTSALLIALGVALAASVVMALAVTAYFTTRVQRSTTAVAHSASRIAHGNYESRVPNPGLGSEFDQLADTINELAQRLGDVEVTRRRLLADLAHEMRTPLASIEAHLEAVEDGVRRLDAETLAVLHTGTQRLHRLADDINAVSRAEEGQLEIRPAATSSTALLTKAEAAARQAYRDKAVRLVVHAETTPDLWADPDRLGQVLGNLLDNALRHTPVGGTVTVTARMPEAGWVDLTVADTGTGIAPEVLPHIFERFYRADPARASTEGGSGIGLTISRALVEAQGGSLTAMSDGPGQGSTFTVRLPVSPTAPAGTPRRGQRNDAPEE